MYIIMYLNWHTYVSSQYLKHNFCLYVYIAWWCFWWICLFESCIILCFCWLVYSWLVKVITWFMPYILIQMRQLGRFISHCLSFCPRPVTVEETLEKRGANKTFDHRPFRFPGSTTYYIYDFILVCNAINNANTKRCKYQSHM